ncbi:DHH family phosphoesterase [Wenjunlia vitaminophila]|uniref:DHH family phosphoesterase n=1 Tax=Wenjunlia vitaminophila TaxID=76728 RepID=UPI000371E1EF|nr:DHH family phosphoesterase [Wenjunlia vitaminophila]
MPGHVVPRAASGGTVLPAPRQAPDAAPPIHEDTWAAAVRLVRQARAVHLVCHVCPDGDALGSALAAALALRSLGIEAHVSFGDDPQVVPTSLTFLPGQDLLVPAAAVPDRPDLVVVCDVASEDRLGLLRDKALAARALLVIDHHSSNNGFGDCRLIDPTAPATAMLVDELLRRLGAPLTRDVATCLYTGVATDTGSFKNAATTPESHQLAARLLGTGLRPDQISRQLWDTSSFGCLKVLASALQRAELDLTAAGGRGLVWTVVPRADRAAHQVPMDQIEGFIDVVRRTAEAEVALVLKENDDGSYYGSSRGRGAVNLGTVCSGLGGGGHAYAAGFTSHQDAATTVRRFRALLEAACADTPAGASPPAPSAPPPSPAPSDHQTPPHDTLPAATDGVPTDA